MTPELVETNAIFSALPVEAQQVFTSYWHAPLNALQTRHGSPNPQLSTDVELLVKLFFVHGYMTALRAERERRQELIAKLTRTLD